MDHHQKTAVVLQAATSGIVLLMFTLMFVVGGALVALVLPYRDALQIGALGGALGLVVCTLLSLELVAAIGCLRGWRLARPVLLGLSVLQLLEFPIGTALGGYTLWAFLRHE